jgi:hypothetical protein
MGGPSRFSCIEFPDMLRVARLRRNTHMLAIAHADLSPSASAHGVGFLDSMISQLSLLIIM